MEPRIEMLSKKKLIGKHLKMSLSNNRTFELWHSFMPYRKTIKCPVNDNLISMQVYSDDYSFERFDIDATFDKWAAVEVSDFDNIPDGMQIYIIEGGMYAVFIHRGPASDGYKTFTWIFQDWLPASGFELDQREHFEILGTKYKNNDPDSEEEVWIPVKRKNNFKIA